MGPVVGLGQIQAAKRGLPAQFRRDSIARRGVSFGRQVSSEPVRRQGRTTLGRITRFGGGFQGAVRDIRPDQLQPRRRHRVIQNHGQGPDFFPGRAGRAPDIHGGAASQPGHDLLPQKSEVAGLAQEAGVVGGEGVDHGGQSRTRLVFGHVPVILVERAQAVALHQAPEARRHQLFFSAPQVEPEGSPGQLADSPKFLGPQRRHRMRFLPLTGRHRCVP